MASLAPVSAEPFYVVAEKSGGIHLRYRIGGRTVDDGRCGIDDNWVEADYGYIAEADAPRFCLFCFPGSRSSE
jgi:hypothetical protein